MSEDLRSNISFRKDKISEGLKLGKNRFGHTVTATNEQNSVENVELEIGGTGVIAHVDIFESPHMKKFMDEAKLSINDIDELEISEDLISIEEQLINTSNQNETNIDLLQDLQNLRPSTLEDFDNLAEKIIGESKFKRSNQAANTAAAKVTEQKSFKNCHSCNSKMKHDAKFCPNCGTPQKMSNFCNNCGNKYDGNENFCSECGTKRQ